MISLLDLENSSYALSIGYLAAAVDAELFLSRFVVELRLVTCRCSGGCGGFASCVVALRCRIWVAGLFACALAIADAFSPGCPVCCHGVAVSFEVERLVD